MGKISTNGKQRLYLGVDVGGTKVQACLVRESGGVVQREKAPTPRTGGPERVLAVIEKVMDDTLKKAKLGAADITAVGIAVPGVVDPDAALVVVTPNMSLTGVHIGAHLEGRFHVPVAVGNDGNLGTLGEKWLGSARQAASALYICVGTGIGAGFVQKGRLWRGARESAGEIGHIVMQIGGPICGCGNHGCLEALASRTAIERDIRDAVAAGRTTMLSELTGGDLSVIRSGAIRRALEAEDPLVCEVVRHASEALGYGCLTVRHLLDPEVIVLGGGVIEACSDFMMPIVENIVGSDRLPGARDGGRVFLSALGDDAVVLGAVALARKLAGRSPFKRRFAVLPKYPKIVGTAFGEITIGRKTYRRDVYILVSGKVKRRDKSVAKKRYGNAHTLGPKELEAVCEGGPEVLFIGAGHERQLQLADDAQRYLSQRAIHCELLPTDEAVAAYNKSKDRKVALFHVTC
jgi:glucokinase